MTHICVSKLITIGSNNGLLPGQHKIIIWTNAGTSLSAPYKPQWNLNRNLCIFMHKNAFQNAVRKFVAILSQPQSVNRKWTLNITKPIPDDVVLFKDGGSKGSIILTSFINLFSGVSLTINIFLWNSYGDMPVIKMASQFSDDLAVLNIAVLT